MIDIFKITEQIEVIVGADVQVTFVVNKEFLHVEVTDGDFNLTMMLSKEQASMNAVTDMILDHLVRKWRKHA